MITPFQTQPDSLFEVGEMSEASEGSAKSRSPDALPPSPSQRVEPLPSSQHFETPPMFQSRSSKSQHKSSTSHTMIINQPSGTTRSPQDTFSKEQRSKRDQTQTIPANDSGARRNSVGQEDSHVRNATDVDSTRNANRTKSHRATGDGSISRPNATSPLLLGTTSPKYRHPSLPALRQSTKDASRLSASTPAPGAAPGSPSSTSFTGGSSVGRVNESNNFLNVLPGPSSIRSYTLPEVNSLDSGGRDPRRLSKYNKFGTASSGLAKHLPPHNSDDFKYQAHTHYKIKVIATIKCGCCREKCSQERGGEVYQCTACTAQICRACVAEKLANEDSETAQDAQLQVENGDQDEESDQTSVKPYKFEWDGYMKHEGFKLCYLERKTKQNGRGDYTVNLALQQIWPTASITPGDEDRKVTVKIFSEVATPTRKRKARNSDEGEPAEGSGRVRRASALTANKKIRATKAGTQEEPIDLEVADKARKREEEASSQRLQKHAMGARHFDLVRNITEHANNGTRPPVVPRIRSPVTREDEIIMDGQVFAATSNPYSEWQRPQPLAAQVRRGSAGMRPQMAQQQIPRQARRPQPVNIIAANAQQAGFTLGTPTIGPLTPFQAEVIQRFQQLQAMQTAQFHDMMQSTGLPTPITGTWPSGMVTPSHPPRRQSFRQSDQGLHSEASTRASIAGQSGHGDRPVNVTLKARPTSNLTKASATAQRQVLSSTVGKAPRMRPVENTAGLPRHFGHPIQSPTSGPELNSRSVGASKLDVLASVAAQTAENEDAAELARPRRISRQLTDRQLREIEQKGLRKFRANIEDDDEATDVAETGSGIGATILRRRPGVNVSDAAPVSLAHPDEGDCAKGSHSITKLNVEDQDNDFQADVSDDDGSESAGMPYDDGDDSGVFNPEGKKASRSTRRKSSNTSTKSKGKGKAPIRPVTADPFSKPPSAAKIGKNTPLRFLAGVPDFGAARNGKTKALKRPKARTEEDAANEAAMLTGEKTRLVDYGSSSEEDVGVTQAAGEIESEVETGIIGRRPRSSQVDEDVDDGQYWDDEIDIVNRTPSKQTVNKVHCKSRTLKGFAKGLSANKAFLAGTATKATPARQSLKTKSPGKSLGRLRSGKEFTGMGRSDLYDNDDSGDESDGELLKRGDRGWSL